jgi:hypothetical protein
MKFQKCFFTALIVLANLYAATPTYAFQKTKDYLVVITLTVRGDTLVIDRLKFKNLDRIDLDKLLKAYRDEFITMVLDSDYKLDVVAIPILKN